jgi:cell division septation protein DedD
MNKFIPLADRQRGIALAQQSATPAPAPRLEINIPAIAAPATPTKPAPRAAPAPVVAVAASGGWRAQLGAYGSPAAAQARWNALRGKLGSFSALQPSYEKAGNFTRLRVGPLTNRAMADRLCAASQAAGQPCFPVAP